MSIFRFLSITHVILACLMLFSFGRASAQDKIFKLAPQAQESVLDNGLHVVVIPDHRAPVVTHMLWYKAGAADEPAGKSGIAHFLEHLMFKGTHAHPEGYFSKRVAAIGGEENAFTSNDYTAYFQRVSPQHLSEMMRLEADRMKNLAFTDAVFLPEREVILEERGTRVGNRPSSQLLEMMDGALYYNHPYGIPIIGWAHEIAALTKQDAFDFYEKFYTPDNAILIVAGDVEVDHIFQLAQEIYGSIPRSVRPVSRSRPQEPNLKAERSIIHRDSSIKQPTVLRTFLVPSYKTAQNRDAVALDILAEILGGDSTSLFYQELVFNEGPAANVSSWYHGQLMDYGQFSVWVAPKPGQNLNELIENTQNIILKIQQSGIDQDALDKVRTKLKASLIYAQDNHVTLARTIGVGLATGRTLSDIQNEPNLLEKITVEDIQRVARDYLTVDHSITGFLQAPASTQPSLD